MVCIWKRQNICVTMKTRERRFKTNKRKSLSLVCIQHKKRFFNCSNENHSVVSSDLFENLSWISLSRRTPSDYHVMLSGSKNDSALPDDWHYNRTVHDEQIERKFIECIERRMVNCLERNQFNERFPLSSSPFVSLEMSRRTPIDRCIHEQRNFAFMFPFDFMASSKFALQSKNIKLPLVRMRICKWNDFNGLVMKAFTS